MRVKGNENAKWKTHWYDDLNIDEVLERMPLITKLQGRGIRIEFSVLESTMDIINGIRESNPHLFKTNADVNRMCHYWGTYIAKRIFLDKNGFRDKNKFISVSDCMKEFTEKYSLIDRVKSELRKLVELAASETISFDDFNRAVTAMSQKLGKDFFPIIEMYIEEVTNSDEIVKLKARLRKRKSRANIKAVKSENLSNIYELQKGASVESN